MTADELIAEGELLVKRCFALSARGSGTPAGYWGGSRADLPDQFPPEVTQFKHRRHIVSVGEPLLAQIGADRIKWVSLYEWTPTADDRDPLHHVEEDNDEPWASLQFSGEPLYATERASFPPFEALCLHGSKRVANWLASLGLERHLYWKVPRDLTKAYERQYVKRLFANEGGADVIVGGWHQMWPEDDFYTPRELLFVLKTLRDAEPWFTVWHSPMSGGNRARLHFS
jgi:hypothetical protein